jgi:hypothetical protein
MGCLCSLYGRDDFSPEQLRQQKGANDVCPKCGQAFEEGDHIVVDDDDTVYHYSCFEGAKPPFEEGATFE